MADPCKYFINGKTLSKNQFLEYVKTLSQDEIAEVTPLMKKKVGEFSSSHFDEKNILVHIRHNTRTDADGKKVLFLEEIQSDWGQKGKKEGFKVEPKYLKSDYTYSDNLVEDGEKGVGYINKKGEIAIFVEKGGKKEADRQLEQVLKDMNDEISGSTPSAPFVTETPSWTKLGLKVALKEAVKQGADKIAWSTGTQQFDRWGSEEIHWKKREQPNTKWFINKNDAHPRPYEVHYKDKMGTGMVERYSTYEQAKKGLSEYENRWVISVNEQKDGAQAFAGNEEALRNSRLSEADLIITNKEELRNAIKRNLARERNDAEIDKLTNRVWDRMQKEESGTSLPRKEGMEAFYGSPSEGKLGIVGEVAKSLFKQEPKTVEIGLGRSNQTPETINKLGRKIDEKTAIEKIGDGIHVYTHDKGDIFRLYDANDVREALKSGFELFTRDNKDISTQHSIDITPELRQEAESGLPLFKDIKGRGKAIADALRKGKIKMGGLQSNIAGIPAALWNTAIDTIALAIEGGATLAQAVQKAIKKHNLDKQKGFNQKEFISKLEQASGEKLVEEVPPGEPPMPPKEVGMGGEMGKEDNLDKLANNVPDTGKVADYLSGETIQKYTGEAPINDQTRGVQELQIALEHGEKIIEEAKAVFGNDYVEKTLDYIDRSKAGVSNKALMYVSLENALGREKLANPESAADIAKMQKLVYEKSQAFARQNSLALNYQKLRKIAQVGYDMSRVTDNFFSAEELVAREVINKATEANGDLINEQYAAQETGEITPEIQKMIEEGIAKEVAKLYEALPKEKKSLADRAIKALEAAQAKLRSRTYDAGLGIPVAAVDAGITVIKNAIKAGVQIAKAIELGIKKIKEAYGKELLQEREDKLRTDLAEVFDKVKSVKDTVKEILIEKGFGREINVKGEAKKILDWKKLSGEAGTVTKISENVGSALKDKGYTEADIKDIKEQFIDEYVSLRQSIIEKAQNELAKRNKETVSPEQKSAAKKLSELYTYGLFDAKFDEYENTLNKALGAKVSEQGFNEAKNIAKALDNIYKSTFKGIRLNDVSAKSAIEKLEDKLRILLFRESKSQGNINLKAANIVRSYFDTSQTMLLNNLKQAVENPFSGLSQDVINTLEGVASGTSNKELRKRQREAMKTIYKDMVLSGGIAYGKVESQFVNRQHLDDLVNKMSDKKLYHAIASAATGKATLNAMDSMFKASITEKKFVANLIKILTHESNPKRMTKKEALQFATERLTGQTYEEAKETARQTIKKINEDAGQELIPEGETQVERLANDIVKASLEMGGKITQEQIQAAYNAAYKSAGLNLGHEANNLLSGMMKGYSAKLEGDISRALKDKEWNRASFLIYKAVLFRNILNPFVGGGTNWLVLKMEKTGLGLFTGLAYKLGSKSDIDLSSEIGLKRLEARLYNQARYKDSFMRGLVGGVTSVLAYGLFKGLADDDEYRKFRGENPWAARYLDIATPEMLLAEFGIKDEKFKQYVSRSFNRGDAFDPVNKIIKSVEYSVKGESGKAWGALGEGLGMKLNAPLPWRLVKDGQVVYQGVTGQDPYHGNYQPSNGFFSGVLQGGVIEWLGLRPVTEPAAKPQNRQRNVPVRPQLRP